MYTNRVHSIKLPPPSRRPLPPALELDFAEGIEVLAKLNRRLSAWAGSDILERDRQVAALALIHSQRTAAILAAAIAVESPKRMGA